MIPGLSPQAAAVMDRHLPSCPAPAASPALAHDDAERARSALQFLDPHDRPTWVNAAFSIRDEFGDDGFELWDSWGSAHKRPASEVKGTWKSATPGGGRGIGSLFYDAKEAGWKDDSKYEKPPAKVIEQRKAAAAARAAQYEAEEAAEQAEAAALAKRLWDESEPCTEHAYLKRKGVKSHGLRYGPFEVERTDPETGDVTTQRMKALLVPMYDRQRELWSLQAISAKPGGKKLLLKGGRKAGNFFPIGKPLEHEGRKVFLLAEGYATSASLHECTGHMTLMCVDSGNLITIAKQVRERDPNAIIVICADNDIWKRRHDGTPYNPGVEAATKAAAAVDGIVAVPPFAEADAWGKNEKGNPTGPKDFNDWHALRGTQAVADVIAGAVAVAGKMKFVLVPTRDEAFGAAHANECMTRIEAEIVRLEGGASINFALPRIVPYEGQIERAAMLVRKFHPKADLAILAAPDDKAEAQRVADLYGAAVDLPPADGQWRGWGEHFLDQLFSAIDANAEAGQASEEAAQVIERVTAAQDVLGDAGAVEQPQSATPARDEERRRQQQDENRRLQEMDTGAMVPSKLTVDEMIQHCVWIAEGKDVGYVTEDRSTFLKFDEFAALTISSKTEVEVQQGEKSKKKWMANASLWKEDFRRVDAMTRTFHPGSPIITVNPDGLRAVNTWRPIKRGPAKADITPFIEHVEYLFPDSTERDTFLDWLAHIEQKPGELPHYGWLHIAENTGTGRNWMASVLARVFRGYVAPNVDLPALLDSPYNGELGCRVLAIVDEVQEGASEGSYRHAERLKSMVNAEMRTINNKYGRKYVEFNVIRWLVFSNHKNALPLNDEDRRFRVVMHKAAPRQTAVYEHLYALLQDAEFINAVGVYLSERDISRFKPGERPPLNADKLAAIAASKPMSTQNAEEIVACWPADLITYQHAIELLTGDPSKKEFPAGMRRAMEEAGAIAWKQGNVMRIKIGLKPHRVWVLRNHTKWLAESTDAIRRELGRAKVDDQLRPAAAVLADAVEVHARLHESPI